MQKLKPSEQNNLPSINTSYQERFLYRLLLVGIFGLLAETTYLLFIGSLGGAVFNILMVTAGWLGVVLINKNYYHLAASLTIMSALSLLIFNVVTEGLSDATIFLFFAFPVLATFLKGKKDGAIWLLTVVLVLVSLYLSGEAGFIRTIDIAYDSNTFQQLILAVFLVALLVYFYQDNLDKKDASAAEHEMQLAKVYTKLKDEINHRKAVGESLDRNLKILAQREARTEAVLQSIGEGVIVVDKEGKVIMINRMTEQLFNYLERDVRNQKYSELFKFYDESNNPLPREEHPIMKALSRRKPNHASHYFFHNYNNEPIPIASTATPVELNGEVIGAIEVFRDITQERAAAKAKDEFLSLASHQLRTPLGAIRWYAERLLKKDDIKGKNREYLKTIYEDSTRMNSLLTDYLNVSRLELGRSEVSIKEIEVGSLIEKILNDVSPITKEKDITTTKKYSDDIKLSTDERLLETIIQNLISNAVKYTPKKGTITISATYYHENDAKRNQGVIISVEDTGIGIPLDQQGNIFTKLFRAENAVQSGTEGTGLGLYSASTAVQKLKGAIWFESSPGHGTNFAVKLPNIKADIINEEDEKEK